MVLVSFRFVLSYYKLLALRFVRVLALPPPPPPPSSSSSFESSSKVVVNFQVYRNNNKINFTALYNQQHYVIYSSMLTANAFADVEII